MSGLASPCFFARAIQDLYTHSHPLLTTYVSAEACIVPFFRRALNCGHTRDKMAVQVGSGLLVSWRMQCKQEATDVHVACSCIYLLMFWMCPKHQQLLATKIVIRFCPCECTAITWQSEGDCHVSEASKRQATISHYRILQNKRTGCGDRRWTLTLVWFWSNSRWGPMDTLTSSAENMN